MLFELTEDQAFIVLCALSVYVEEHPDVQPFLQLWFNTTMRPAAPEAPDSTT